MSPPTLRRCERCTGVSGKAQSFLRRIRATAHAFKSHHLNPPFRVKPQLHVQFLARKIIALSLHVQISVCSVSGAGNTTSSKLV